MAILLYKNGRMVSISKVNDNIFFIIYVFVFNAYFRFSKGLKCLAMLVTRGDRPKLGLEMMKRNSLPYFLVERISGEGREFSSRHFF